MKKSLALTFCLVVSLIYVGTVQAQQNRAVDPQTRPITPVVQNRQAIEVRNQGETQRVMLEDQEQMAQPDSEIEEEETDDEIDETSETEKTGKSMSPRADIAREKMSVVAQEVEKLLADPERAGGIGEKVREVARKQQMAQEKIQAHLEKIEQRKTFLKSLIGPDFDAIDSIEEQIEENQQRIEELQELQAQETDPAAQAELTDLTQTLSAQNEALSEKIEAETEKKSLFGWLFRLMNK